MCCVSGMKGLMSAKYMYLKFAMKSKHIIVSIYLRYY